MWGVVSVVLRLSHTRLQRRRDELCGFQRRPEWRARARQGKEGRTTAAATASPDAGGRRMFAPRKRVLLSPPLFLLFAEPSAAE